MSLGSSSRLIGRPTCWKAMLVASIAVGESSGPGRGSGSPHRTTRRHGAGSVRPARRRRPVGLTRGSSSLAGGGSVRKPLSWWANCLTVRAGFVRLCPLSCPGAVVPPSQSSRAWMSMDILSSGTGEFRFTDPDVIRAWMRDHKRRDFVDKTCSETDAVSRFVKDGAYISFDFSSFTRGPLGLIREIIRQGRRNLWYCAKFTLMESTLLAAAGAVARIDVGFIHVPQADVSGNGRCFGPGVSPLETAMAARRVIISTDEIVDHDDIRKDPAKTTIPYYMVDAVVYSPFGAYPGGVPGLYEMDYEHWGEYNQFERQGRLEEYLDRYIYSVASNTEMLEKRVGLERLNALRRRATVREGYR